MKRSIGATRPARGGRLALRFLLVAGALALVVFAVRAVKHFQHAAQGPHYETVPVTRGDLRVTVKATGKLQALGAVDVGSEVSGRIQSVQADYNDHVKKGQVLAELDPVQLRAEAAQASSQVMAANANVRQAEATLTESTKALERAEAQSKLGLIANKDLESARASYDRARAGCASANANASVAQANLSSTTWRLGKTRILSPIDGVVIARLIEPGQTVAAAFQTPVLFRLAEDLAKLELHVDVDEADIGQVRAGMDAQFDVDAYPERKFPSRVQSVRNDPKTSQNVVTYEAILRVDNREGLLRPGMTATATVTSGLHHDALLVRNAALRFTPPVSMLNPKTEAAAGVPPSRSEKRVFTLANGKPRAVDLSVGATDGASTEILAGSLSPGAPVIVDVTEDGS